MEVARLPRNGVLVHVLAPVPGVDEEGLFSEAGIGPGLPLLGRGCRSSLAETVGHGRGLIGIHHPRSRRCRGHWRQINVARSWCLLLVVCGCWVCVVVG